MSEYCKNCYELAEQLHRYKRVVKEIKEISKEEIKNMSEEFIRRTPIFGVHKQILQKISEVLKDE